MASTSGSTSPKPQSSGSKDAFHRLVRTISGRSASAKETASPPAAEAAEAEPDASPALQRSESSTSVASETKGKRRFSVGDRLKKLSQDLPLAKFMKGSKSGASSPKVSGDLLDTPDSGYASPTEEMIAGHAKMLSMVAELSEGGSDGRSPSTDPTDPADQTPSSATLARRLQDLIDALPFPSLSNDPIKVPKPPSRDKKGRPIAPPAASKPIKDSSLIALLSSATFMNGGKDRSRPSVWDVLEQISVPPHAFPPTDDEPQPSAPGDEPEGDGSNGGGANDDPSQNDPDIFTDNSSVMVYSPLIPGLDDHVELAELVPVAVEEEFVEENAAASTSWTSVWPLSILSGSSGPQTIMEANLHSRLSGDVVISPHITTVNSAGRKVRVTTVRAWVPSTTKLSFQAMWWGYRLYLPPPVLAILSDKTLEATKRAAMITTALTWFFNHLPVDALPLAVRPAALLMQRIVPFLGYIGTFISWSWSTIKSYDVGYGVTLTATWLLPIALIPGTWFERDFPTSPSQSPPANLPDSQAPAPPTPDPAPSTPPVPTPSQPTTDPSSPTPTAPPDTNPTPTVPTPQPPAGPPSSSPQPPAAPAPGTSIPPTPAPPAPTDPSTVPSTPIPTDPTIPSAPSLPGDATIPSPNLPGSHPPRSKSPLASPRAFAMKFFSSASSTPKVAYIPVPPTPVELAPVPPVASPAPPTAVPVGSPLSAELLHGPVLGPVPLPEEDEAPAPVVEEKEKKKLAKAFFGRIGR